MEFKDYFDLVEDYLYYKKLENNKYLYIRHKDEFYYIFQDNYQYRGNLSKELNFNLDDIYCDGRKLEVKYNLEIYKSIIVYDMPPK